MISESSSNDESYSIFSRISSEDESWIDSTMREELEGQLVDVIDYLPENQQELIRMRIFQGYSFKEIAEIQGISINTALGRMRYAVQNIRKIVEEKELVEL
jgi:RNA polymerase sigma-70 factor (ECF subfamily)